MAAATAGVVRLERPKSLLTIAGPCPTVTVPGSDVALSVTSTPIFSPTALARDRGSAITPVRPSVRPSGRPSVHMSVSVGFVVGESRVLSPNCVQIRTIWSEVVKICSVDSEVIDL